MTAIVVFLQADRGAIFVATDAAVYDRAEIVFSFKNKTSAVRQWPGAVTNTGNAAATSLVVEALSREFCTWDAMIAAASVRAAAPGG